MTPPARPRFRCERLDDRITPAAGPPAPSLNLPMSATELVAQIRSADPLTDLVNIVGVTGLASAVDLAASSIAFVTGGTAVLEVVLRPGANAAAVSKALAEVGNFDWVGPNYVYVPTTGNSTDLRERIPNDPKYPDQLHHPIIRSPDAWDRTYGSPDVITAVIDDGVEIAHPDLKDSIWSNPREIAGNGFDDDANGFVDDINGWDFVNERNAVGPDSAADDHGTRVAGLLAGRIDNGEGVAGVAGRTTLMPLKVVGDRPTTSITLARAVGYAVTNGARIINNSLNIDGFVNDPVFRAAVQFAHDRGLLWVNSAGNGNLMNPPRQTLDQMLIVAATDRADVKTGYSNYGTGIDISAPGGTPSDGLVTTDLGGSYSAAFGTSMAAPLVSGTAALIWSAFPSYTREQVAAAITGTAASLSGTNPSFVELLGSGRLDAGAATSGAAFVTRLGSLTGLPGPGQSGTSVHQFTLRLVSTLDPAGTGSGSFELRAAGQDNQFGTSDDRLIPLTVNANRPYQYGTNQFEFVVGVPLTAGLHRFTARAGGLTDPFGRPVDGDGDGSPGGDLVRTFGVAYQVIGTIFEDTDDGGSPGPTSPGVAGTTVFADANNNGIFDQSTFASAGGAVPVPDDFPAGVRIPVVVSGIDGEAYDLRVFVRVEHRGLSDLTITLVSPSGERLTLLRNAPLPRTPAGAQTQFEFADGIAESSSETPTLVTVRRNPVEPLSRFRGEDVNGTWYVEVSDGTPGDTGRVLGAAITVGTEASAVTDAIGTYTLVGITLGPSVPILVDLPAGWAYSAGGRPPPIPILTPAMTTAAEVTGGDAAPPVRIGLVRLDAVYGRVGAADGSGLADVCVFLDLNRNGTRDPSEPAALADGTGRFVIANVGTGQYQLRAEAPAGFSFVSAASTTVALTPQDRTSTGSTFVLARDTGPVGFTAPTPPPVRTTAVDSLDFTAGQPLAGFDPSNLVLTRNGQPVPLAGVTVVERGSVYTVAGLAAVTGVDGLYELTVAPPGPPGDPGRAPVPVTIAWTTDASRPTATLETVGTIGVEAARVRFSEAVVGLSVEDFTLTRNGAAVPLAGVTLVGTGTNYELRGLAPLTRADGVYRLELRADSGAQDSAGNALAAAVGANFTVETTLPPLPPLPPTPGRRTAVGVAQGSPPLVTVFGTVGTAPLFSIVAYDVTFTGGVRVTVADVTGDGVDDIITAAGPGGGPHVRIFDGRDGRALDSFQAFEESFTGGAYVVAGDLTGDGRADIIVTPDLGGGPRVRVFDGVTRRPVIDFFGIDDAGFRGGARAAVGDVNFDATPDLLVAAGFGGGPRIAGYDGRSFASAQPQRLFADFFAFEETLRNGVFLAAGDVTGDGFADLVLGGGPSGGPRVLVLDGRQMTGTGTFGVVANFFAADPSSRDGIRVTTKHTDDDRFADVLTGEGGGPRTTVRTYRGADILAEPGDPFFVEFEAFPGFAGGVFVG